MELLNQFRQQSFGPLPLLRSPIICCASDKIGKPLQPLLYVEPRVVGDRFPFTLRDQVPCFLKRESRMNDSFLDEIQESLAVQSSQVVKDAPTPGQMRKRLRIHPPQALPDDRQHFPFA